jgi:hypothetical protein
MMEFLMKTQVLSILALSLLLATPTMANMTKRGVHTSSDEEIHDAQTRSNTAGESDFNNDPRTIDQQRMEANPKGLESDPSHWPDRTSLDATDGERVED